MNKKQLEILQRDPKLKIEDLENVSDRTLLFGSYFFKLGDEIIVYHLYIENEMFHFTFYEYKTNKNYQSNNTCKYKTSVKSFKYREDIKSEMFIFDVNEQKFDPFCSDYEFCEYLKLKGIVLLFKPLDEETPVKKFYGILYPELKFK